MFMDKLIYNIICSFLQEYWLMGEVFSEKCVLLSQAEC